MTKIWKNDSVAGTCGFGSVILPKKMSLMVSGFLSQTMLLAVVYDSVLPMITLVVVCSTFMLLQFNG